ncbi:DNA-binding protein [Pseudonocardia xishanensis]|uniref:DNA-binding protein n=1 Tax=Pseudonocardia xishanensis TaxID=630995 RepID=A0ABP8S462_9PSEU
MATPSLDEIREWGPTCGIPEAAKPLGISRSYAFELARLDTFPCRVLKVGRRYRVVTSSLVALLESGQQGSAGGAGEELKAG